MGRPKIIHYAEIKLPLREWTHMMIYKGIIEARGSAPKLQQSHNLALVNVKSMREEFLKLVEVKNGEDLYAIDKEKALTFTDDDVDLMLKKQLRKRATRTQQGRYIVEYITKDDPPDIAQSDVTVDGNTFIGVDGCKHYLNERGCKIIETILNNHRPKRFDDKKIKRNYFDYDT